MGGRKILATVECRPAHREADLAAVDDAWADLCQGRPGIVAIEGGRGVGKTTLLSTALARLPGPAVILKARCTAAERNYQFGVVEQLFDHTEQTSDAPRGDAAVSPGVLHDYVQAARSMSDTKPVVVAIDDLHLADEQSVQWLSYLTRRLDEHPLAVIVTVDEATPAAQLVERMVDDVAATGFALALRPEPLCETCTETVAGALLDSPLDTELAVACHELSQGNPLVLREYVNRLRVAGVAPGSPDLTAILTIGASTLADTALEWLHERNPAAAQLLGCMALLGAESDHTTAALLVGQGELVASESLAALRHAGLVGLAEPVRITSSLVSSAALSRISAGERMQLHVDAAQLLTRLGSTARRAADHLLLVGPGGHDWAVPILRSAAREAVKDANIDAAVRYLRRAAAESDTEPGALALDIASLELHHDLPSAIRCIETALPELPTREERAGGLAGVANPVLLAEGVATVQPFVDVARELGDGADPISTEFLGLGAMATLAGHRVALPRWVRSLYSSEDDGERGPERALFGALAAVTAAGGRRRARAMRLARRSADGAMDLGAVVIGAVVTACWAEEFEDAARWATWMTDAARARQHRGELALALVARASVAVRIGDLQAGLDDAREATGLADAVRASGLRSLAAATTAGVLAEQDRLEQAGEVLGTAQLPIDAHPLIRATLLRVRGVLAARSGDHAAALRLFQECGYTLAARGLTNPACVPWRSEVVACHLALGEPDAARAVAADDVDLATRWGAPGALGRGLLALSRTMSDPDSVRLAEDAASALRMSGMRLEFARACEHLAEVYRAAGDDTAAEEAVRRGAWESAARGQGPSAASRSAPAAGAAPGTRAPGEQPRLTFSEGRVTDLVLQGLTNQEAADSLCISRRTVDTHLNRIYRKLGINSRGELAEILREDA